MAVGGKENERAKELQLAEQLDGRTTRWGQKRGELQLYNRTMKCNGSALREDDDEERMRKGKGKGEI